ncbi:transposase [Nocardia vinacea]|uniref:Transposase n=1 Tax=Nocardia vinacea TaxID=96468 RepID=A0ABZ1YV21_9NOCA|nr:transposase [Nocardia vinacea]
MQDWRTAPPPPVDAPPPAPTPRQVTGWMMKPSADLTDDEKQHLQQILHRSDTLTTVNKLVSDFAGMVRERRGRHLDTWIADATNSGITHLSSFATGLLNDYDAVRNGLTLEWSSGAVEGNVNRIKMIKRTMYGRANFDLLRLRVLLAD